MSKIKDFVHNSNDIILALVITAIAVGVIFWRLTVILDYPKSHAISNTMQTEASAADKDADAKKANVDSNAAETNTTSSADQTDKTEGEG